MRKLFLTSGFILCLVYPAFADINAGVEEANCTESVLGATSGSVSLSSGWRTMISGAITLNSGRYTSNEGSAVQRATTSGAPATMYAVYGVGVYDSQPTTATLSNFTTSNRLTSLSTTPQLTGYTFAGVYTTPFSGGTQVIGANGNFIYDAASTQFDTENATSNWYVRWTANTHAITYGCGTKPSGASTTLTGDGPSGGTVDFGSTYTLSSSYGTCALPGYTATGWDCTGGATLTNATGQQSALANDADIACTVHWTANTINLNYYQDTVANGATTPFTTDTCTYDSTFDLPTNYNPKNGYHFNGWIVRSNGNS